MIVCYSVQSSMKNIYRDLLLDIIIKLFFYLGNAPEWYVSLYKIKVNNKNKFCSIGENLSWGDLI